VAVRQLSAIYLAAASAYTVAIALSQHPILATQADEAGTYLRIHGGQAAAALDSRVLVPGWKFAREEAGALTAHVLVPGWKLAGQEAVSLEQRIAGTMKSPVQAPVSEKARLAAVPERTHPRSAVYASRQIVAQKIAPPPFDVTGLRGGLDVPPPAPSNANADAQTSEHLAETGRAIPPHAVGHSALAEVAPPQQVASADVPGSDTTSRTASPVPNLAAPSPAELARVEQRLKDSLSPEMLANFELFLYVSKAATGPLAQRMYVFQKETSGNLTLAYNWPVSTGRERVEFNAAGTKLPSFTPAGYYELDPKRSYVHYRSMQWGHPMPYAMFFNWKNNGYSTGLAIHSATGDDIAQLGTRASAGCVRLSPEAAKTLFTLIRTHYRGLAPRFAINRRTGTMSNEGIIVHDADGHAQLAEGYKVLVFIENYGGENVVAALF
jgi:lipoprotein-anchoring transpeptidase ErfK/SrfK